jgi:hypothetical protein
MIYWIWENAIWKLDGKNNIFFKKSIKCSFPDIKLGHDLHIILALIRRWLRWWDDEQFSSLKLFHTWFELFVNIVRIELGEFYFLFLWLNYAINHHYRSLEIVSARIAIIVVVATFFILFLLFSKLWCFSKLWRFFLIVRWKRSPSNMVGQF